MPASAISPSGGLKPTRAHAVAGFGRIETMAADEVFPSADEMIALEEGAIAHMNDDHADAVQRYAGTLLGASPGGWKIAAIDTDGADLQRNDEVLRLPFEAPVYSGDALRRAFAAVGQAVHEMSKNSQIIDVRYRKIMM